MDEKLHVTILLVEDDPRSRGPDREEPEAGRLCQRAIQRLGLLLSIIKAPEKE